MLFAGESISGSASLGRRSCTTRATSAVGQRKATRRTRGREGAGTSTETIRPYSTRRPKHGR
eukprot:3098171-Pyramimonas_sp.AAC.2